MEKPEEIIFFVRDWLRCVQLSFDQRIDKDELKSILSRLDKFSHDYKNKQILDERLRFKEQIKYIGGNDDRV